MGAKQCGHVWKFLAEGCSEEWRSSSVWACPGLSLWASWTHPPPHSFHLFFSCCHYRCSRFGPLSQPGLAAQWCTGQHEYLSQGDTCNGWLLHFLIRLCNPSSFACSCWQGFSSNKNGSFPKTEFIQFKAGLIIAKLMTCLYKGRKNSSKLCTVII